MSHDQARLLLPQLTLNVELPDLAFLVGSQVAQLDYLRTPTDLPPGPPRTYTDNQTLWRSILEERLRASMTLTLRDFYLFEWLPRSPGLFYTPAAQQSREWAMQFLISNPNIPGVVRAADATRLLRDRLDRGTENAREHEYIFSPPGKGLMLEGGIGCIRLKPLRIEDCEYWLMSASSSGVAHEGFPVAVPERIYRQWINAIADRGVLRCTLIGQLRFIPDSLVVLYEHPRVPRLYLNVDEIRASDEFTRVPPEGFEVSVGISFEGVVEQRPGVHASYVTFDPSVPGSAADAIDWLDNVYVKGLYQGQVITDFDEQMGRFAGAMFSLQKVMSNRLDDEQVRQWVQSVNVYGVDAERLLSHVSEVHIGRVETMSYEKKTTVSIGAGATVSGPVVVADRIEGSFNKVKEAAISSELKEVLSELLQQVSSLSKSMVPEQLEQVEAMSRDAETLVKEVASPKPRRTILEATAQGIKDAAEAVGEVGVPILTTLAKLLPLIPPLVGA